MKQKNTILNPYLIIFNFLLQISSLSASNKYEILPSVRFNVHCTSESIELQNLVFPPNTFLQFFLSSVELYGTENDIIIQQILNAGNTPNSRSVLYSSYKDISIKFPNLKGSQTYYLYYILTSESGPRVGPFLEIIKTTDPFILSALFWKINPFGIFPVLIPVVLLMLSVVCVKKLEKKCVKQETKMKTRDYKNERIFALHSLRPEFKFPQQVR